MERLKALIIVLIIIGSLIPVHQFNNYLKRKLQPKESFKGLLAYMLIMLTLIFSYTFAVVFIIRTIFPDA